VEPVNHSAEKNLGAPLIPAFGMSGMFTMQ